MADSGLSSGMRWSGVSVVGKEVLRAGFTIMLARLVGPDAFGTVAQAMVYIGLVGLLVDQGFSSALIQRKHLEPDMPGVVVSVNVAVGAALTAVTVAIAPLWASFMRSPPLMLVLVVLAPSLLIRAAAFTPRAMLMRNMEFRKIGFTDIVAAVSAGTLGILVAVAGRRLLGGGSPDRQHRCRTATSAAAGIQGRLAAESAAPVAARDRGILRACVRGRPVDQFCCPKHRQSPGRPVSGGPGAGFLRSGLQAASAACSARGLNRRRCVTPRSFARLPMIRPL